MQRIRKYRRKTDFSMLRIVWQGPRALQYCVLLATPMYTTHYVLSAHAHNLAQHVGKGRQQAARIIELSDHRYALTSTLQRARGMCSIEL